MPTDLNIYTYLVRTLMFMCTCYYHHDQQLSRAIPRLYRVRGKKDHRLISHPLARYSLRHSLHGLRAHCGHVSGPLPYCLRADGTLCAGKNTREL